MKKVKEERIFQEVDKQNINVNNNQSIVRPNHSNDLAALRLQFMSDGLTGIRNRIRTHELPIRTVNKVSSTLSSALQCRF